MFVRNIALASVALMMSATVAVAAPDAAMQADNQGVESACSAEITTAGCTGKTVGHGLMKCMKAYKKSNPGVKYSDACKAAVKQRHADKKAHK